MEEAIMKLISCFKRYDIFTIILPGFLFFIVCDLLGYNYETNGWFKTLGMVFLFGLISSRIGVAAIATVKLFISKKDKNELFLAYKEYLWASKKDRERSEMLVGNLNWYRSLIGMSLLLIIFKTLEYVPQWVREWGLILGMLGLFIHSYCRQVYFIRENGQANLREEVLNEADRV